MKRSVLTVMLLVLSFAMVGAARPASAQPTYQFGYQFLHLSSGGEGENFPLGFDVNAGIPLGTRPLKVFGDVSWGRGTDTGVSFSALTFGGGARWMPPTMPRLAVQAVVGIERDSYSVDDCDGDGCSGSESNIFFQPGVQYTIPWKDTWDWLLGGHFRVVLGDPYTGKGVLFTAGLASK